MPMILEKHLFQSGTGRPVAKYDAVSKELVVVFPTVKHAAAQLQLSRDYTNGLLLTGKPVNGFYLRYYNG